MTEDEASGADDDPSVDPVETLLSRAASFVEITEAPLAPRPTSHALWICACVTMDDAPTWLIYEESGGGLVWCRVPDRLDVSDVVEAESIAGGHTDPWSVLQWLEGKETEPWSGGEGWGDRGVLERFNLVLRE